MVVLGKGTVVNGSAPVSLVNAKLNSNIEHSETEDYLQLLLDAAIDEAESYTGRPMLRRTGVKIGLESWSKEVLLQTSPVTDITSVTYKDKSGNEQTLDATDYVLVFLDDRETLRFVKEPGDLPELLENEPYPIEVIMDVGYSDSDFPSDIKQGIMLIFSDNELYREDRPMKLGRSSRVKLRPYRINR
jgi:uncharacterized phiE125 gp8 family phage protein